MASSPASGCQVKSQLLVIWERRAEQEKKERGSWLPTEAVQLFSKGCKIYKAWEKEKIRKMELDSSLNMKASSGRK